MRIRVAVLDESEWGTRRIPSPFSVSYEPERFIFLGRVVLIISRRRKRQTPRRIP